MAINQLCLLSAPKRPHDINSAPIVKQEETITTTEPVFMADGYWDCLRPSNRTASKFVLERDDMPVTLEDSNTGQRLEFVVDGVRMSLSGTDLETRQYVRAHDLQFKELKYIN